MILLLLLLLLVIIIFFLLPGLKSTSRTSPEGNWKFYFTYSNDTNLIYRGNFQLSLQDSTTLEFEITAPKSTRAEKIKATNVSRTENQISGTLLYDRFKIRGGYLKEHFNFIFENDSVFNGEGRCLQYCAEGTEEASIRWHGTKDVN